MILVSACLLGENCKYSGKNNFNQKIVDFLRDKDYITVCPEVAGGLPTPRHPVELRAGKAVNDIGEDKTAEFKSGAMTVLDLCRKYQPELVILKEGSPSCGVHQIYDGTFSGRKINGRGLTASLLCENGYRVISDEDIKNCDTAE